MIQEVVTNDDGKVDIIEWHAVAVKDYGSEGCTPLHRSDCPIQDGDVACVSGSGGSICSGFYGHAGNHVIRCTEPLK